MDIIVDNDGNGHAFSYEDGQCIVHTWDCLSICLRVGYSDTGIRIR